MKPCTGNDGQHLGEGVGSRAYVVLTPETLGAFANANKLSRRGHVAPFPEELLTSSPETPTKEPTPPHQPPQDDRTAPQPTFNDRQAGLPTPKHRPGRLVANPPAPIAATEGHRNVTLFDLLLAATSWNHRHWGDFPGILGQALTYNAAFQPPLPSAEVRDTAASVTKYSTLWDDTNFRKRQAQRGQRGGYVRWGGWEGVLDRRQRDRDIHQAHAQGERVRGDLETRFGLRKSRIYEILAAPPPAPTPHQHEKEGTDSNPPPVFGHVDNPRWKSRRKPWPWR